MQVKSLNLVLESSCVICIYIMDLMGWGPHMSAVLRSMGARVGNSLF